MARVKFNRKLLIGLLASIVPFDAFASVGDFALTSMLMTVAEILSGELARVFFVVAIIAVGYGWLHLGRIPKDRALATIGGMGIIFSASFLATKIGV